MLVLSHNHQKPIRQEVMQSLPWVTDVTFGEGLTPDGASAVLVYLVAGTKAKELRDGKTLSKAAQVVLQAFTKRRVMAWPYVRFISADDQRLAAG